MDNLVPMIAGGAAGLGILVLVTMTRPAAGLVLLLIVTFLVPVELSAKIGDLPRIGPLRIAVIAFLIGLVLRSVLSRQPVATFPGRTPTAVLAVYIGVLLLTTLFSIDLLTSVYYIVDQLLLFFFFYLFWQYCRDEATLGTLKLGLYLGAAIVCMFAFIEAGIGFSLSPTLALGEQGERLGLARIRSTFYHPIALGAFVNLVFPFVLADLFGRSPPGRKLLLAGLAVALVATQFLTLSRMPLVVMAFEAALVFILARPSVRRLAGAYALGVLAVAAVLILPLIGVRAVGDFFGSMNAVGGAAEASSEYYRVIVTMAVLQKLEGLQWLTGFGPGTFHVANIEAIYAGNHHILTAPDLHYVRVLADSGLAGLAAFLCVLGAVVWLCCDALRRAALADRPAAAACLAAVLGFILVNATVSMFYTWPLALSFWLVVARAAALRDKAVSAEDNVLLRRPMRPLRLWAAQKGTR